MKMQTSNKTVADELQELVHNAFMKALGDRLPESFQATLQRCADPRHGEYQCNDALALAKSCRQAPRLIAQSVQEALPEHPLLKGSEVAGPGFLNFRLEDAALAERVLAQNAASSWGIPQVGAGKTVVMDYSSPNVAKPMHIGHIRSTVIGNALDRLHRACGYHVLADNHLGDWGTQFGLILMGYRNFLNEQALAENPVQELERVYVESYGRSKEDPAWLDAAKQELVKLQQGDAENLALWQKFVELSLSEFEKIYSRLDVRFDLERGESFYNDMLAGVLERLDQAGLLEESDGAQVVNLEEEKLGVCIVQKSDGGFNYATTDIATVLNRKEEFDPETVIYVTDERQQLHFKQFFRVVEQLGVEVNLQHVWFGLMRLPDATFSTRQGNVIKLEALLDEAESRAMALLKESRPDMDPEEQKRVAAAVGIGAVKYADLSQNPQSVITFTWEKALALDGNSAPYLQYAHARIRSVLDKYAVQFPGEDAEASDLELKEDLEHNLAVKLLQYPETVVAATRRMRPNQIADYLFELAQMYSSYHQTIPFLKADDGVRQSRMRLIRRVADVLQAGLKLLGIEAPERI